MGQLVVMTLDERNEVITMHHGHPCSSNCEKNQHRPRFFVSTRLFFVPRAWSFEGEDGDFRLKGTAFQTQQKPTQNWGWGAFFELFPTQNMLKPI